MYWCAKITAFLLFEHQQIYQSVEHTDKWQKTSPFRTSEVLPANTYSTAWRLSVTIFNNGNGRTGRIVMNIVAMKLGYQPLQLYHREGESRKLYIHAMKAADKGNINPLTALISEELVAF